MTDSTRYNSVVLGSQLVRAEGTDTCRLRIHPQRHHTNAADKLHGGTILGHIDVSLFAAMYMLRGIDPGRSVTVDLNTQFIGAGDPSQPLDAVVEVLRETRRLAFLRGLTVQAEMKIASFSGTVRKPSTKT